METTQMLYLAGAFVLGFIVAWFAGRGGPKRALEECEANAHSLQRSLDDRSRSISKLESQLKEQIVQVDRLGSEQSRLSTSLQSAEQTATDAGAEISALQTQLSQAQSDKLLLEAELGHVRDAYAGTRTRLADLFSQSEAQAAEATAAADAQAENTALAIAEAGRAAEVEQLTAQVQLLQVELEAVRANASRLAGQVALRPQLSSSKQQEYAALADNPERIVAALHERDMAVADARAETDYLRRTVGMLTGMGAELASEVERRRREQQVLLYQVAGLNATTREMEIRQLVDRQASPLQISTTDAGTIEPEGDEPPITLRAEGAAVVSEPEAAEAVTDPSLALRGELEERTKELDELRTQSDTLLANLDELQAELEALNAANADLEAQLETRDGSLQEMQNTLAGLQVDAENAASAKAALEEKLQVHGLAWGGLVARIKTLNTDLEAIIAEEPAEEPAEKPAEEPVAPSDELAALAATAPVDTSVPEGARAADAVLPAAEHATEEDGEDEAGDVALNKLAAGVAAAVAIFQRKKTQLADYEQQVNALSTEKGDLESSLAAKADLETQFETRSSELSDLQNQFAGLQTEAESAAAAKIALAEKLQLRGGAWSSLVERISQLNANLDGLIAAEPLEGELETEPFESETVESDELNAASVAEAAAEATEPTDQVEEQDEEVVTATSAVNKLAAGVTAALAIVQHKNSKLAGFEQQVGALSGDKGTLESTLAAKDQSLVAAQAQVEQLQTGINQRSVRFDALSMHASSMEAEMEIGKLERAKLEEQVRAVAANLQALLNTDANGDDTVAETVVAEAVVEGVKTTGEAVDGAQTVVQQSSWEELSAAATAVADLVRSKDGALLDAHTQLTGLQAQLAEYDAARQALAAELENKGLSMADVESRLQSLQSDFTGVQSSQGDLEATLKTLGEELDTYLAEYGEADDTPVAAPPDEAPVAADADSEAQLPDRGTRAVATVGAIGALLQRRKDALESANVRVGELEAEISALTSQKNEMDAAAEQQEQALADLTEQLATAQAEAEARRVEIETLQQQLGELTVQKGELDVQSEERELALADLTAQLTAAQADLAERTTDAETLRNQLVALQAQTDATEQERVRLDSELRSLNDDLAQFGAALDADDDVAIESLTGAMAQRLGASVTAEGDAEADRSLSAPLIKTAGAVALTGVARKKLLALKATSADLGALQQEHTSLLGLKSDLDSQLQQESATLEETRAQLAAIEAQLAEAKVQHAEEVQVLDAKTAELQSQYNEAEADRLRLEGSLTSLNQELQQLGMVLESDDEAGLQQFVQKSAPAPDAQGDAEADSEDGAGAVKLAGVAAVAAALQRKQAALKEADARAATMQAELDEASADREAAKSLLADRDLALQEVETKLTEVKLQAEKTVSDFKAAARAAAVERGIAVQETNVLQDFAELKHIGVTFEQRLYRAGAGTFWEIAHLTDEDFALILRLTEMQQLAMDLNETRSDAVRLADETGTLGMISAGETPDDFEPIQGIGKVFEQRLYSAGIRTYWDLANTSEERLAEICKARKPLVPDYASWIRQARILAEVRSE